MNPAAPAPLFFPAGLGWALLLLLVVWTLRFAASEDLRGIGWKWWLLAAGALLCLRWPMLWVQHQLNPDESQLIAGALTLRYDPLFWRSVDGATAGPVDYYPLLPAAWGNGFASYVVARLIALAAVFGGIVLAGESLALLAGAALARITVLPALAAVAFTTSPDLTHYSTELMPALLIAVAGWLAVRQQLAPAPWRPWAIALVLGSVPWAKLQAVPLAVVLGMLVIFLEYRAGRPRSLLPLVAGSLLPAVLCFGGVALAGQAEHMVVPYVIQNLAYTGAPHFSWGEVAAGQWRNALNDGYFAFWLGGATLCLLPFALWQARRASQPTRRVAVLAIVLFAVAVYSTLAPRRPSAHHLQLLPVPMLWLSGSVLALAWAQLGSPGAVRQRRFVAGCFLLATLGPQLAWRARGMESFADINAAPLSRTRVQLAALVRAHSSPGEPLAVWGWRCSLYVEAGRPQATRQAQSELQLNPGPNQGYFLRRYLEDFQRANPPVFADAVGPGNFAFFTRDRAHECFPALRAWVQEHYTQIADLDGTRLYVRNDRLAPLPISHPES